MANVMPTTDTATNQAIGELHFTILEAPAHVPKLAAGQAEEALDSVEVDSPRVAKFKKTLVSLSVKVSKLCKAQRIRGSEMLGEVIYDWFEILKNDMQLQKERRRIALSWFVRHENFGEVPPILRISEFVRPTPPTAAVPKEATKVAQKQKERDGPEAEITKPRGKATRKKAKAGTPKLGDQQQEIVSAASTGESGGAKQPGEQQQVAVPAPSTSGKEGVGQPSNPSQEGAHREEAKVSDTLAHKPPKELVGEKDKAEASLLLSPKPSVQDFADGHSPPSPVQHVCQLQSPEPRSLRDEPPSPAPRNQRIPAKSPTPKSEESEVMEGDQGRNDNILFRRSPSKPARTAYPFDHMTRVPRPTHYSLTHGNIQYDMADTIQCQNRHQTQLNQLQSTSDVLMEFSQQCYHLIGDQEKHHGRLSNLELARFHSEANIAALQRENKDLKARLDFQTNENKKSIDDLRRFIMIVNSLVVGSTVYTPQAPLIGPSWAPNQATTFQSNPSPSMPSTPSNTACNWTVPAHNDVTLSSLLHPSAFDSSFSVDPQDQEGIDQGVWNTGLLGAGALNLQNSPFAPMASAQGPREQAAQPSTSQGVHSLVNPSGTRGHLKPGQHVSPSPKPRAPSAPQTTPGSTIASFQKGEPELSARPMPTPKPMNSTPATTPSLPGMIASDLPADSTEPVRNAPQRNDEDEVTNILTELALEGN
ncbi:hypothetical protein BKA70DRAFT_1451906 [Coprinopsis sp. MPI-PUGE-AT-0042]|nr:hypothetical protein BKA70DRAFT_1451906 [Coprinopsis sp. MPI-PUGE-AT-0042]